MCVVYFLDTSLLQHFLIQTILLILSMQHVIYCMNECEITLLSRRLIDIKDIVSFFSMHLCYRYVISNVW
jgi:hypothetical protein